jgi:hypothetical protein
MSSSRILDDAVSIFEPSVAPLPAPPLSSMNRSVRWKYENATSAVEQDPNRAKFMNKLFGGVSSRTPANSFRHVLSQDDSSTVESSVVLHMVDTSQLTSYIRDELRLRTFGNDSPDAPHLSEMPPPPPSATTKTRQTSPKIPERRKFFMDKLFTVSRLHVNEAGVPSSPGKATIPRRNPITCTIDGDSTTTDANSSIEERGDPVEVEKPWVRTQTIVSPVPEQQNWYEPPSPAIEQERVLVPTNLPPLLPLKRPKEEDVEAKSVAPRRWKLYWDDWVHAATSLHCIASCSAADFRCDDTSEFRSQMEDEEEDFFSMPSFDSIGHDNHRGPYAAFGGDADDSLISSTAFENDTLDERYASSDYWSGFGSPTTTGDDATSFSSQNSAWL